MQRYASWMRGLHLGPDGRIPRDTYSRLSRSSAGGVLFPRLEWLRWDVDKTDIAIPCFHLFFPPQLKEIALYTGRIVPEFPEDQLAALVEIISLLTSSLEDLTFKYLQRRETLLEDAISSFVCQRGTSLRSFDCDLPLSEAAIRHLMRLPNLRFWFTIQEPPRTVPPIIFPSLNKLHLDKLAALLWLPLLASHGNATIQHGPGSATSHTNTRDTLNALDCPNGTTINSTFLSSIVTFRNLVVLVVPGGCSNAGGCIFRLTDDDVENLAAALPQLNNLQLARPCSRNSCETTVSSLLSLSTHCLRLEFLVIHFNTRTVVGDMQRLLDRNSERDEPKCKLGSLKVGFLPLHEVRREDIGTVAMGFKVIFPCLIFFKGKGQWSVVQAALKAQD